MHEDEKAEEGALGIALGEPVLVGDGPVTLQRFANGWKITNPSDEARTLVWEGRDIYLPPHKVLAVQMRAT